jgi:hypothetical protein
LIRKQQQQQQHQQQQQQQQHQHKDLRTNDLRKEKEAKIFVNRKMSHPARYLHSSRRMSVQFQSKMLNCLRMASRVDRRNIFFTTPQPPFTKPKQFVYSSRVFLAQLSLSLTLSLSLSLFLFLSLSLSCLEFIESRQRKQF